TNKVVEIDGFTVHYIKDHYSHNKGVLGRIMAFFNFMLKAYWLAAKLPKPDLIYATSTPLTILVPALLLKWTKGIPFIFEVRDLWPEAPIELGILKNGFLKTIAKSLALTGYREAESIVVLSPDMQQVIEKQGIKTLITVIPNIANTDFFKHGHSVNLDYPLTIGYFGTMGLANGITQVTPLLKALQAKIPNQWRFVFAGEGNEKELFLNKIKAGGLSDNLEEWPSTNLAGIKTYLERCHFSYVSFNNQAPILGSGSPNKFFDSLAAGVPIILNFEGWLKDLVTTKKLGFIQPSNDMETETCANEIISMFKDQQAYLQVKSNCLAQAKEFNNDKAISKLASLIKIMEVSD
ncbi:MAG: glycosyltransferase family 4 protein, partial [Flexibacteraceae bacterium]